MNPYELPPPGGGARINPREHQHNHTPDHDPNAPPSNDSHNHNLTNNLGNDRRRMPDYPTLHPQFALPTLYGSIPPSPFSRRDNTTPTTTATPSYISAAVDTHPSPPFTSPSAHQGPAFSLQGSPTVRGGTSFGMQDQSASPRSLPNLQGNYGNGTPPDVYRFHAGAHIPTQDYTQAQAPYPHHGSLVTHHQQWNSHQPPTLPPVTSVPSAAPPGHPHYHIPGPYNGVLSHPYNFHSPVAHHHHPQPLHQERPFKCDQCPQAFNRNHDLKRHKRIHMHDKPFRCDDCGKSFSRKDALKRHRLVRGCEPKREVQPKQQQKSPSSAGSRLPTTSPRIKSNNSGEASSSNSALESQSPSSAPQGSVTDTSDTLLPSTTAASPATMPYPMEPRGMLPPAHAPAAAPHTPLDFSAPASVASSLSSYPPPAPTTPEAHTANGEQQPAPPTDFSFPYAAAYGRKY